MNAIVDQNCQNSCQCFVNSFATGNQIQGNFVDEMAHYIFPAFKPKIPLLIMIKISCISISPECSCIFVPHNLSEISFPLNKEGPNA